MAFPNRRVLLGKGPRAAPPPPTKAWGSLPYLPSATRSRSSPALRFDDAPAVFCFAKPEDAEGIRRRARAAGLPRDNQDETAATPGSGVLTEEASNLDIIFILTWLAGRSSGGRLERPAAMRWGRWTFSNSWRGTSPFSGPIFSTGCPFSLGRSRSTSSIFGRPAD